MRNFFIFSPKAVSISKFLFYLRRSVSQCTEYVSDRCCFPRLCPISEPFWVTELARLEEKRQCRGKNTKTHMVVFADFHWQTDLVRTKGNPLASAVTCLLGSHLYVKLYLTLMQCPPNVVLSSVKVHCLFLWHVTGALTVCITQKTLASFLPYTVV